MPAPPRSAEVAEAPTLEALRALGVQQLDPARFRLAEALVRRASLHGPAVQAAVQPRLQRVLAELAWRQHVAAPATPQTAAPAMSPLGGLLATLNRPAAADPSDEPGPAAQGAPAELKALSQFRSTWAALSVDRQLHHSLAQAPENPGPLNSHRLVLRALQMLQALSPAYLQRFMAHADALLHLEQLNAANAPAPGPAPRRESKRTPKPKPAPARTRAR